MPVAELAKATHLDQSAKLSLGMKLTVPGAKSAAAAPVAAAPAQQVAALSPPATRTIGPAGAPPQAARLASATTQVEEKPVAEAPGKASEATGALPSFRWPVRGKVMTAYGAKTNGKANDGINVAVPEGTPVKSAEDGVVAYAGNELKGFGNMVLLRHAGGWVTAYAHNSSMLVQKGAQVKQGQTIARVGSSGNVDKPQLHFELRQGTKAVDPMKVLTH